MRICQVALQWKGRGTDKKNVSEKGIGTRCGKAVSPTATAPSNSPVTTPCSPVSDPHFPVSVSRIGDTSDYSDSMGLWGGNQSNSTLTCTPPHTFRIGDTSDYSDSMGSWGGNQSRCYSAPHMWNAGWATPATTLSAPSDLPAGAPARLVAMPMQNAAGAVVTTGVKILGAVGATSVFALRCVCL